MTTIKQHVRQLLTDLLALPDGTIYQDRNFVGVCGYLIRDWPRSIEGRSIAYAWCEKNARAHVCSSSICFVDRPSNELTPKRRKFVEDLLTKIDDLPDMPYKDSEDDVA